MAADRRSSRRRRSCSAARSPATCASATQDATDDELWHALEIAQGRDFVAEMEGGLEAPITQGGTNVSGGQRQRLAIARALVKRAGIVIFDDSFSALDFSDRCAAAGGARPGARLGDRDHRRPAGRHDHERRPDPGDGRRPGRRHRHARASCWRPTRPTARSSTRSCPRRRRWHERRPGADRPAPVRPARRRPDPAAAARAAGGGHGMMGMGMPRREGEELPRLVPAAARPAPAGSAADRARDRARGRQRRRSRSSARRSWATRPTSSSRALISKKLPAGRDPGAGRSPALRAQGQNQLADMLVEHDLTPGAGRRLRRPRPGPAAARRASTC